jgi:FSR family fosmidomycin resistance protein-like MFS transporter
MLFSVLTRHVFSLTATAYLFIVYNLLAFGLQVIIGFVIDSLKAPRLAAVLGLIVTGLSTLVFLSQPVIAIIIAGLGNALFHIGGGIISLNLTPRKAAAPGIFVAPGALGVLAGTLLGKSGNFVTWPFLAAMTASAVIIFLMPKPAAYQGKTRPQQQEFKAEHIIYLTLFVIAVRSLVGFAAVFPWKSDVNLLILLTAAVVLGKGLGGLLADKFGWQLTAAGSLAASIPLLTLGASVPACGIIGMFLFNINMPVTLAMMSNVIPGKPGTAFGLTCLALVLGTLPSFTALQPKIGNILVIDIMVLIAAVVLYFSLHFYNKIQPANKLKTEIRLKISPKQKLQEEK